MIYVAGGNTVNLLAVWRAHGVDAALREAWEAGVVLCGMSAGSLCWFEAGVTDSYGPLRALHDGLGLLARQQLPPLRRRGRAPAHLPARGRRGAPGRDRGRRLLRPALRRHRARRGGQLAPRCTGLPGRAGLGGRRRDAHRRAVSGRMTRRVAASLIALGAVNLAAPHLPAPSRPVQIAAIAIVSFPLAALVVAALAPARASALQLLAAAAAAAATAVVLIVAGLSGHAGDAGQAGRGGVHRHRPGRAAPDRRRDGGDRRPRRGGRRLQRGGRADPRHRPSPPAGARRLHARVPPAGQLRRRPDRRQRLRVLRALHRGRRPARAARARPGSR